MMSKEKMSPGEAKKKLIEWGELQECNVLSKDFKEAVNLLIPAVQLEKLTYNSEKDKFSLRLFRPIEREGERPLELIEIGATTLKQKRQIQNFKESEKIDRSAALLAEACDLPLGIIERLKDKDSNRASIVYASFFG
jgi:hypothetical protein